MILPSQFSVSSNSINSVSSWIGVPSQLRVFPNVFLSHTIWSLMFLLQMYLPIIATLAQKLCATLIWTFPDLELSNCCLPAGLWCRASWCCLRDSGGSDSVGHCSFGFGLLLDWCDFHNPQGSRIGVVKTRINIIKKQVYIDKVFKKEQRC